MLSDERIDRYERETEEGPLDANHAQVLIDEVRRLQATNARLIFMCRLAVFELGVKFVGPISEDGPDQRMLKCLCCKGTNRGNDDVVHAEMCVTPDLEAVIAVADGYPEPPPPMRTQGGRKWLPVG